MQTLTHREGARLTEEAPPDRSSANGSTRRLTRWADSPLAVHAGLLLALLVIVAVWIGPGSSFTSDEGASVLQAQAIEHGHWVLPDPLARIDPLGRHYPIELSATGSKGSAPLGKHLFYGAVLALAGRVAGVDGMIALSLLGTVVAALLAAALSRELRPGIERQVLWFVGLGTPLLFDGFLLVAQAVAAALGAGALLLALRYTRHGGRGRAWALCCVCVLSCLLRTEALLWCVGMAAGVVLLPPAAQERPLRRWTTAALILGSGLLARGADTLLTRHAVGASPAVVGAVAGGHSLGDQLHAAFVSWLQAEPDPFSVLGAWMVVTLVVMAVTARMLCRGRFSSAAVLAVGAMAVVLWGLRLRSGPSIPVGGLAVATPVLWSGLWLTDRRLLREPCARLCAVAALVFTGLVLATQYSDGGGLQWGGRFFAMALPAAAPVALEGIRRQAPKLVPSVRAAMAACLVVVTGTVAAGAIQTLHTGHAAGAALAARVEAVVRSTPAGDGGDPVVLTSEPVLPRLEWPLFTHVRWQLVPPPDMAAVAGSLRTAGISAFVLATTDPRMEPALFSATPFRGGPVQAVPGVPGWYLVSFHAG